MHGTLRFILAILVVLSHLGITFYGYNPGVSAVVIFYMLAGMVSYKLLSTKFEHKPFLYYLDRIKRIFPLYFLVLTFSYILYILGASSYFISDSPNVLDYISNLIIIPLSYYMYSGVDKFTLVPPVWSLGVELQFYIIAPFIILYLKRLFLVFFFSMTIYILAIIGILQTDYFGYRLIIGVIFIFLIGVFIQKAINEDKYNHINPLIVTYIILFLVSIYVYMTKYKAPYNHETLIALLVGIPLLLKLKKTQRFTILDKYLGTISYAVFLLHFPVLWLVKMYGYSSNNIFLIVSLTIILSSIFIYFEKKLLYRLSCL